MRRGAEMGEERVDRMRGRRAKTTALVRLAADEIDGDNEPAEQKRRLDRAEAGRKIGAAPRPAALVEGADRPAPEEAALGIERERQRRLLPDRAARGARPDRAVAAQHLALAGADGVHAEDEIVLGA